MLEGTITRCIRYIKTDKETFEDYSNRFVEVKGDNDNLYYLSEFIKGKVGEYKKISKKSITKDYINKYITEHHIPTSNLVDKLDVDRETELIVKKRRIKEALFIPYSVLLGLLDLGAITLNLAYYNHNSDAFFKFYQSFNPGMLVGLMELLIFSSSILCFKQAFNYIKYNGEIKKIRKNKLIS